MDVMEYLHCNYCLCTCGFRINAKLVKEGSFRINAQLVKEEIYSHSLCNYSVSTLSRGCFAICSSYFISGVGAGNLKISCQCCLTVSYYNSSDAYFI